MVDELRTYQDEFNNVQLFCDGRKSAHKSIIRSMAEANGLPSHVTRARMEEFFGTDNG